jgi:protein phosphatase 2C family protein 2/3
VYSFKIIDEHDFIVLGCDGIYDTLSNKEIFEAIMATFEPETPVAVFSNKPIFNSKYKAEDLYTQMGIVVDSVMKSCFKTLSSDNLSVILICFSNFKSLFENPALEKNALKLKHLKNENINTYSLKLKKSKACKNKKLKGDLNTSSTSLDSYASYHSQDA